MSIAFHRLPRSRYIKPGSEDTSTLFLACELHYEPQAGNRSREAEPFAIDRRIEDAMPTNSTPHTAASRVIRGIKDTVSGQVQGQKDRAAEGIVAMAEAVQLLSDELRGHNHVLANVANTAGTRLHDAADLVREADAAEIAHSVAQFARRRPVLFVGAAFVVGLGVSQLLKTTATGRGPAAIREAANAFEDLSASSVGA